MGVSWINDTESGAKIFYCIKCIEVFETDHEMHRKKGVQAAQSFRESVGA